MINLAFVMAFIGVAIALLIGLTIFSSVSDTIQSIDSDNEQIQQSKEETENVLWVVIGLLPIVLFFVLFAVFSGIGGIGESFSGVGGSKDEEQKVTKPKGNFFKWLGLELLWAIGLAKKEKGE
jgi:ATP-dependent Zn protease